MVGITDSVNSAYLKNIGGHPELIFEDTGDYKRLWKLLNDVNVTCANNNTEYCHSTPPPDPSIRELNCESWNGTIDILIFRRFS